jgi:hypothetical protein
MNHAYPARVRSNISGRLTARAQRQTVVCCLVALAIVCAQGQTVRAQEPEIHVDAAAGPGGDGSRQNPFRRITDAVNTARAIWRADKRRSTKIEIRVGPGTYVGSYSNSGFDIEELPIRLDVPGLEFVGSTSMLVDAHGLPTGDVEPGTESILKAEPRLAANQSLLIIGPTDKDLTGEGVELSNMSFNVGYPLVTPLPSESSGVLVERARDFTLRRNYVTGGTFVGIQTIASSGTIEGNYITQVGCGTCLGPGSGPSPARVVFRGNRSVNNFFGGVLLLGGGTNDARYDTLAAVVEDNDLSDNNTNPTAGQGFGIRAMVVRHDPPEDVGTTGNVIAAISNNRVTNNKLGISIDAGFPYRTFAGTADDRRHRGTLELSFVGNDVFANHMAPALISFTRSTAALTPAQLTTQWKYLERSTFDITDADGSLAGYWVDHPPTDPADGRTLRNVLRINGAVVPNGRYVPFP